MAGRSGGLWSAQDLIQQVRALVPHEMRGLPRGAGSCLESYGGKEAYYPMLKGLAVV
jgi:hypothetical protein